MSLCETGEVVIEDEVRGNTLGQMQSSLARSCGYVAAISPPNSTHTHTHPTYTWGSYNREKLTKACVNNLHSGHSQLQEGASRPIRDF